MSNDSRVVKQETYKTTIFDIIKTNLIIQTVELALIVFLIIVAFLYLIRRKMNKNHLNSNLMDAENVVSLDKSKNSKTNVLKIKDKKYQFEINESNSIDNDKISVEINMKLENLNEIGNKRTFIERNYKNDIYLNSSKKSSNEKLDENIIISKDSIDTVKPKISYIEIDSSSNETENEYLSKTDFIGKKKSLESEYLKTDQFPVNNNPEILKIKPPFLKSEQNYPEDEFDEISSIKTQEILYYQRQNKETDDLVTVTSLSNERNYQEYAKRTASNKNLANISSNTVLEKSKTWDFTNSSNTNKDLDKHFRFSKDILENSTNDDKTKSENGIKSFSNNEIINRKWSNTSSNAGKTLTELKNSTSIESRDSKMEQSRRIKSLTNSKETNNNVSSKISINDALLSFDATLKDQPLGLSQKISMNRTINSSDEKNISLIEKERIVKLKSQYETSNSSINTEISRQQKDSVSFYSLNDNLSFENAYSAKSATLVDLKPLNLNSSIHEIKNTSFRLIQKLGKPIKKEMKDFVEIESLSNAIITNEKDIDSSKNMKIDEINHDKANILQNSNFSSNHSNVRIMSDKNILNSFDYLITNKTSSKVSNQLSEENDFQNSSDISLQQIKLEQLANELFENSNASYKDCSRKESQIAKIFDSETLLDKTSSDLAQMDSQSISNNESILAQQYSQADNANSAVIEKETISKLKEDENDISNQSSSFSLNYNVRQFKTENESVNSINENESMESEKSINQSENSLEKTVELEPFNLVDKFHEITCNESCLVNLSNEIKLKQTNDIIKIESLTTIVNNPERQNSENFEKDEVFAANNKSSSSNHTNLSQNSAKKSFEIFESSRVQSVHTSESNPDFRDTTRKFSTNSFMPIENVSKKSFTDSAQSYKNYKIAELKDANENTHDSKNSFDETLSTQTRHDSLSISSSRKIEFEEYYQEDPMIEKESIIELQSPNTNSNSSIRIELSQDQNEKKSFNGTNDKIESETSEFDLNPPLKASTKAKALFDITSSSHQIKNNDYLLMNSFILPVKKQLKDFIEISSVSTEIEQYSRSSIKKDEIYDEKSDKIENSNSRIHMELGEIYQEQANILLNSKCPSHHKNLTKRCRKTNDSISLKSSEIDKLDSKILNKISNTKKDSSDKIKSPNLSIKESQTTINETILELSNCSANDVSKTFIDLEVLKINSIHKIEKTNPVLLETTCDPNSFMESFLEIEPLSTLVNSQIPQENFKFVEAHANESNNLENSVFSSHHTNVTQSEKTSLNSQNDKSNDKKSISIESNAVFINESQSSYETVKSVKEISEVSNHQDSQFSFDHISSSQSQNYLNKEVVASEQVSINEGSINNTDSSWSSNIELKLSYNTDSTNIIDINEPLSISASNESLANDVKTFEEIESFSTVEPFTNKNECFTKSINKSNDLNEEKSEVSFAGDNSNVDGIYPLDVENRNKSLNDEDIYVKAFAKNVSSRNSSQSSMKNSVNASNYSDSGKRRQSFKENLNKTYSSLENNILNDSKLFDNSAKNSEYLLNDDISEIENMPEEDEFYKLSSNENMLLNPLQNKSDMTMSEIKTEPENFENNSHIISKEESYVFKNDPNVFINMDEISIKTFSSSDKIKNKLCQSTFENIKKHNATTFDKIVEHNEKHNNNYIDPKELMENTTKLVEEFFNSDSNSTNDLKHQENAEHSLDINNKMQNFMSRKSSWISEKPQEIDKCYTRASSSESSNNFENTLSQSVNEIFPNYSKSSNITNEDHDAQSFQVEDEIIKHKSIKVSSSNSSNLKKVKSLTAEPSIYSQNAKNNETDESNIKPRSNETIELHNSSFNLENSIETKNFEFQNINNRKTSPVNLLQNKPIHWKKSFSSQSIQDMNQTVDSRSNNESVKTDQIEKSQNEKKSLQINNSDNFKRLYSIKLQKVQNLPLKQKEKKNEASIGSHSYDNNTESCSLESQTTTATPEYQASLDTNFTSQFPKTIQNISNNETNQNDDCDKISTSIVEKENSEKLHSQIEFADQNSNSSINKELSQQNENRSLISIDENVSLQDSKYIEERASMKVSELHPYNLVNSSNEIKNNEYHLLQLSSQPIKKEKLDFTEIVSLSTVENTSEKKKHSFHAEETNSLENSIFSSIHTILTQREKISLNSQNEKSNDKRSLSKESNAIYEDMNSEEIDKNAIRKTSLNSFEQITLKQIENDLINESHSYSESAKLSNAYVQNKSSNKGTEVSNNQDPKVSINETLNDETLNYNITESDRQKDGETSVLVEKECILELRNQNDQSDDFSAELINNRLNQLETEDASFQSSNENDSVQDNEGITKVLSNISAKLVILKPFDSTELSNKVQMNDLRSSIHVTKSVPFKELKDFLEIQSLSTVGTKLDKINESKTTIESQRILAEVEEELYPEIVSKTSSILFGARINFNSPENEKPINHGELGSVSEESLVSDEDFLSEETNIEDQTIVNTTKGSSIFNKITDTLPKNTEDYRNDSETSITNENTFVDDNDATKKFSNQTNSIQINIPKIQTNLIKNRSLNSVNRLSQNFISNKTKENSFSKMIKNFETGSIPGAIQDGNNSSNQILQIQSISTAKNIQNNSKSLEMLPNNSEISVNFYHSVNSNLPTSTNQNEDATISDTNSKSNEFDLSANKSGIFYTAGDYFIGKKNSTNTSSLTKLDTNFAKITFDSLETQSKSLNEIPIQKPSQVSFFSGTYNTVPFDFSNTPSDFNNLIDQSVTRSLSGLDEKSADSTSEIIDEESEMAESSKQDSSTTICSENTISYLTTDYSEGLLEQTSHSIESMPNLSNKKSDYQSLKEFSSLNEKIMSDKPKKHKAFLRKSPLYVSQYHCDGTAKCKEYERKKLKPDDLDSTDTSYESGQIQLKEGSLKSSILDVKKNENVANKREDYSAKKIPNSAVIMMYRDDDDYVVNTVHRESHKK